jgi:peptidyl-prolyl cis-trans isomerase C
MRRTTTAIGLLALTLAVLTACKEPVKPEKGKGDDVVLAKVGEVTITVNDFEETINSYSPYLRQKYNSPEMRKKKLEEMVEFELLALEAKNLGYAEDPSIQEAVKQQLVRELQEQIFENIKLEDITEEEAKAYYDAHPDKYHKPAQIRIAHVELSDGTKAEALLAELIADETNTILWRDSVVKYSEDPKNQHHGGDLGYVSKVEERTPGEPKLADAIVNAAHEIKEVGHIYPDLVEVDGKFHILKLTSTRPPIDRTFDQVRRQIQSILWKEKREKAQHDFIENLKKEADLEVHFDLLDEVQIPEPAPPVPPAQKGGAAVPVVPTKAQ